MVVLRAERDDALDQRGVRRSEGVAVEPDIVLEPGAAMAAEFQRPAVERDLAAADPGAGPDCLGGERFSAFISAASQSTSYGLFS